MRIHLLFSLLSIILAINVSAQSRTGKASGAITDNNAKALPSASVSLLRAKDSSLIKIAVSNKEGKYEFESLSNGDYLVSVTSIGFQRKFGEKFSISESNQNVQLAGVSLTPAAKNEAEVTVTAKKPFIETKIDKTVVNVDASPTSAGSTALEILEKSPGISVDNDGNISLRGKSGVIVMMDGKQTYLSASDLANLLRNTPASALDQIEIMTNPSAKYDATGNSGIINIKTKKGRAAGFNGSIMASLTTSFYKYSSDGALYVIPKSQNSINFNYRKNKINFFGNYNPNFNQGRNRLEIDRKVLDDNKELDGYIETETKGRFRNNNHNLKLGLDYFLDKKNTLGVVVSGFALYGHPEPATLTRQYDANHVLTGSMLTTVVNNNNLKNFSTNFNYRHVFDSTGREFTTDLDYIVYDNVLINRLNTDVFDAQDSYVGSVNLKGYLPADINIYSLKSDYSHPFKNGARFEAGIKISYVKNDNEVDYMRKVGSDWVVDSRTNHFKYDENINAAYVNYSTKVKRWSFQAGLRLENTQAKGYQVTNDSSFKRDFTNLFPTAFISYELNKTNQLTLNYGKRVTRPNYQDLNPFIFFLDSLSFRKGNPFLVPQFSHNIELIHAYKSRFITTLNYNNTTDVLTQILKPDPINKEILFLTPENVAKFRNIGLAITAPFPVTKWWNVNLFTNVFNNRYQGFYNGQPVDTSFTSFMVNMTQTFTIKPGFTAEISGFYRAKTIEQMTVSSPMGQVSFGGQKTIMKGKGTLRLNLRDPFWLQRWEGKTRFDKVDTRVRNRWDNRQVTASFTWRFGKTNQQVQPPRRRNSASQDEQNRVGQGGQ
jgi:iron complex outermembrane receptor protein